ncbi:hypothetical protein N0V90_009466 [Kalmusia sp. IMI 367209]|nr:hypothetical protein N0V90_009466 [Kalmusia sp. IMI 367209]
MAPAAKSRTGTPAIPTLIEPINATAAVDPNNDVVAIMPDLDPRINKSFIIGPKGDIIGPPKNDQEAQKLVITMGIQRQHAGLTVSLNFARELRDVLNDQCWNGDWTRIPAPMCCLDTRRNNDIYHNSGTNAHLQITFEVNWIPGPSPTSFGDKGDILRLFIDQLAATVAQPSIAT